MRRSKHFANGAKGELIAWNGWGGGEFFRAMRRFLHGRLGAGAIGISAAEAPGGEKTGNMQPVTDFWEAKNRKHAACHRFFGNMQPVTGFFFTP
jgi:hypothetical protein